MHSLNVMQDAKIIAVIRLDDLSQAQALCRALVNGGIRALEFTLTNPAAIDTMSAVIDGMSEIQNGDVIIGMGSALSAEQAQASMAAGAQFIVSPHVDLGVIEATLAEDTLVVPGAMSPTEMMLAHHAGAQVVKVFPAPFFGPTYLKTVLAPLPFLKLMPSGGVTLDTINEYLDCGAIACGVGSALVNPTLIKAERWGDIQQLAEQFVAKVASR